MRRVVGACARDAVTLMDSVARDPHRHGGLEGASGRMLGAIRAGRDCFLARTFGPVEADIVAIRGRKPKGVLAVVERMRRDATAHLPLHGTPGAGDLTAGDTWQAYGWFKAMLEVWSSRTNPPVAWPLDEDRIVREVLADLGPFIAGAQSTPA